MALQREANLHDAPTEKDETDCTNQAEDEVIPGADKGQQRRGDDARHGDRQHDQREGLQADAAVHHRRLLQLLRQRLKIRDHDPDDQRQRNQHVTQDQAGERAGETDLGKDQIPRDQERDARNDAHGEDDDGEELLLEEFDTNNMIIYGRIVNIASAMVKLSHHDGDVVVAVATFR